MGYHLTILRSESGVQIPISLVESIEATQRIGGWSYTELPSTFEYKTPEGNCTLWHDNGELWTKNPEVWGFDPMLKLAEALGARVRGDEFETYRSTDETYFHPDDEKLRSEAITASKATLASSLRDQRKIRNGIIGVFFVLAVTAFVIGKWLERQ